MYQGQCDSAGHIPQQASCDGRLRGRVVLDERAEHAVDVGEHLVHGPRAVHLPPPRQRSAPHQGSRERPRMQGAETRCHIAPAAQPSKQQPPTPAPCQALQRRAA